MEYDASVHERFIELDAQGRSASEIARALGTCARTISRWRKVAGRSQGEGRKPPTAPELLQQARALIDDGCSIAEAARTIGVSPMTLGTRLPDAPRYTHQQAGQLSVLARMEKQIRERTTP